MMSDQTAILAEIKARADAATEGPWESGKYAPVRRAGDYYEVVWLDVDTSAPGPASYGVGIGEFDAEFICHAREDVPRLVAAVEAVLAIHCDEDGDCDVCEPLAWPCPTVRAITAALAGES